MQIRQQNSYMTIDTYKNCEIQTKQECDKFGQGERYRFFGSKFA